jgi:para-aminobenzoate synthetase / 4-amino-4-deoxychorismate lyase
MSAVAHSWRPDLKQGIFETVLVVNRRPIELVAHLTRLEASLAELYPGQSSPPLDLPAIEPPDGASTTSTSALSALRIAVAPGGDGKLEAEIEQRDVSRGGFMSLCGTNPPQVVSVESLTLAGGLGAHKWADRSLLDAAQSNLPADTLPLVIDADDAVLEASRANIFAVRDGALLTPPTDGRILPGTTRARLIEIADGAGLEVSETALRREDLLAADEVFLTGSVRGVEWPRALDGRALPGAGEVGHLIAAELRRRWSNVPVG